MFAWNIMVPTLSLIFTNSLPSLSWNVNHISRICEICQEVVLTCAPETDVKMSTEHGHWCHLLSTAQEHYSSQCFFFLHMRKWVH